MNAAHTVFRAMALRHLVLLTLTLLSFAGLARAQVTINIDNSSYQYFAVDAARNFLYVAEASNAGTKHLSVVNTLTNTVVGTYSFSSGGYTSQVAASGTDVFWAIQGTSQVRVLGVDGSGTPSVTRSDSAGSATGIAALGTTYAVSKQGGGDLLDINLISTGAASFANINLSGVAGQVYADSNTNRYYARSSSSFKIINGSTGSILGTLTGLVMAIDPSAGHNYIYLQNSGTTTRLDQLAGTVTNNTVNTFYDFGAAFNDVAVNTANGDIFVAQSALNRVVQLNSSMAFVQNIAISSPESIAFANGQLYVHGSSQAYLSAIAIPEPSTWAALLGGLGLGFAVWRRRATRVSPKSPL
jgi:hypothetical protein